MEYATVFLADCFTSFTQDTILALQALSQFAAKVFQSGSNLHLGVLVADVGRGSGKCHGSKKCLHHQFIVNNSNRLVRQSVDGGLKLPTTVQYSLNGTGCALVQVRCTSLSATHYFHREVGQTITKIDLKANY